MTATLDAPATLAEPGEPPDPGTRRTGEWTRWRVATRLARRQAWRAKGSSALVVALVALPVAGLAGAATFWASHEPSPEQAVALELGEHQSWIEVAGGPDPSRWQAVDVPYDTGTDHDGETGAPIHPVLPSPTKLPGMVPDDALVMPTSPSESAAVETPHGAAWLATVVGEPWNPAFRGLYVPLDGDPPTADDEFMVSPGALTRLGAEIGDQVVFPETGLALTISGTMRAANAQDSAIALFVPRSAADAAGVTGTAPVRWYVADWQPTLEELGDLNRAGYLAYARDLALDPPAGARLSDWGSGSLELWNLVLVGAVAAVVCGYVVVLLAGAAFSVAARRQQRALAVAASVGAGRADVFRIVVLQGVVLGLVGGILGSVVGIAGAAAVLAATDRGALGTFWGNFGLSIPLLLIGSIVLFAVAVGTIAALAPARSATRGDILSSLRGARRPALLRPKRPLWGLLVMGTGLVALVAGGLYVAATLAAGGDTRTALFIAGVYGVALGPILFQIGLLIPAHWVLVQISHAVSPIGLAPRIASRDAAAAPSRVVPAFAVIGACIFAASFALSITAMTGAANARQHWHQAPKDALVVQMWQMGTDASADLVATAEDLVAPTAPEETVLVQVAASPETSKSGEFIDPEAPVFAVARQSYQDCAQCSLQQYDLAAGMLSVVDPDDVSTLLGAPVGERALETLRAGGAIVTDAGYLTPDDEIIVTQWSAASHQELMTMGVRATAESAAEHPIPAVTVDPGHQQAFEIIVSPQTAAGLGLVLVPSVLVATYETPLPPSTVDRLVSQTMDFRIGPDAGLFANVEAGPAPIDPTLWLIVGIAMTLVLGASAVALGLARFERRPDDATLTAVGASRRLRRHVNAWQVGVIVGVGAVIGTLSGSLSVWGMTMTNGASFVVADMPWVWLGVLAIGLPLAITAVAWLVPPRHPDLTRRTAIA